MDEDDIANRPDPQPDPRLRRRIEDGLAVRTGTQHHYRFVHANDSGTSHGRPVDGSAVDTQASTVVSSRCRVSAIRWSSGRGGSTVDIAAGCHIRRSHSSGVENAPRPEDDDMTDELTARFESVRPHLRRVAYRVFDRG